MPPGYRIVAFSHLRWDFVYQRPQHLLSRLARRGPVIIVEEPVFDPDKGAWWERTDPAPNLTIYRPHTPVDAAGFAAEQLPVLKGLLSELKPEIGTLPVVTWLYTPMALPLAQELAPQVAVYDCMDELSMFAGAPPELLDRENELLGWADLVFTGGRSLYRAKQGRHPNVHCFPSSVDAAHFRQALTGTVGPSEQAGLPHPRLGFFGVIDERLDVDVIAALADADPTWQVVLVGPIVKIDPAVLPRRPNIHYFGQRSYHELPAFLAGWDVCLLPFARNDATRFISPTKTLEYMAAERPIISTPITDVAEPYGDVVYLAATPAEFVAACRHVLGAPASERAARCTRMREVLGGTSWDATAAAMERLIVEELCLSSSSVLARPA